ncbi:hypothetical protein Clacol_008143 [Clathrus columnatus]|uniref:Uncharacterized protein n=1 Tax=Clathrus columnatus TaxID=1419009 RepID=A0AAV5ALT0_9AGAM|nr:hypothetical protein Clacol_008143 [Clathrus columnatus]
MSLSLPIPKAVLYYHPRSVWSSAGTIPALVVPLDKTLAANIPHRYKALTSTKTILEFLDKSRLVTSKTNTTSSAPAPALRPATISLGDISNRIIETLHSTPINFVTLAAVTQEELISKAAGPEGDFVKSRHSVLESYLNTSDANVGANIKTLWEARFYENEFIKKVYLAAEKLTLDLEPHQATEREAFFKQSRGAWVETKRTLGFLETHIISPYTLGDYTYPESINLHLAAWLSRIFHLVKTPHTPLTVVGPTYDGFHTLQEVIRRNTNDPNFVIGVKARVLRNRREAHQVTISIFDKGANAEQISVKFTPMSLHYENGEKKLVLEPLTGEINPEGSSYTVGKVKVEVRLAKTTAGRWVRLVKNPEEEATIAPGGAAPGSNLSDQRIPSKKNWDRLTTNILNSEKDKTLSDDPNAVDSNRAFAELFANVDDDAKRAIMKSYTESGGTTLSTDWNDVKKGTVPVRPPEGQEWKKWG